MVLWGNNHFFNIISTPDFPRFYYMLGATLGSLLYGDVFVLFNPFRLFELSFTTL